MFSKISPVDVHTRSNMKNNIINIPHLEEIKEIRRLEQIVSKETDIPIYDLSHWNAGDEYIRHMMSQYKISSSLNCFEYHYSYEFDHELKQRIINRLTHTSTIGYNCVLTHNSTAAICCIGDYLKKKHYKKICVIEPAYFSIYSCLLSFGLNVFKESIVIDSNNKVVFPYENIIKNKYDAVWITSPIFSTGIYFDDVSAIHSLAQKGVLLLVDESASSPNHSLFSQLYSTENVIAIFSPHKYLSINSTKFAAIICPFSVSDYLEDWIDVFIGSLPMSSCIAIEHFMSSNFVTCVDIHDEFVKNNLKIVNELCTIYPDNYYNGEETNYITIRNETIPFIDSLDKIDMLKIMRSTHVSFIPGYINGFSKKWGFCYRINLTNNPLIIKNGVGRLFNFFWS